MRLSRRVLELEESPTLALQARVAELQRAGRDIVSFALGEPDFDTPRTARDRAQQAIDEGHTHYTANAGILPLRNAARAFFKSVHGLEYAENEVIVSPGSKFDLYAGMLATLEPGDEALVVSPAWVSTVPQIELTGAKAVVVPARASAGFIPDVRDLAAKCTPATRVICLNSPHNPTGAVYPESTLAGIADLALERDLVVISDEIYQALVYGTARHVSIATVRPGMRERTLVVWGVAKSFAMTGWRIGIAAGPRDWIAAIDRLQGQITSCANSIAQYAALQALLAAGDDTRKMQAELARRRLYVTSRLRQMPHLSLVEPEGAFYVFPGIQETFGRTIDGARITNSFDFCRALLEVAGVAATPGSAFGCEGHIRIAYSVSQETIETGLDRLEEFLGRLAG